MSTLEPFDQAERDLFRQVVGARDPSLLGAVEQVDSPSPEDRARVVDALASEFDDHVSAPEWLPSERGKRVDDLLGRFLLHFPIEPNGRAHDT